VVPTFWDSATPNIAVTMIDEISIAITTSTSV